jgi:hypothetical protein
MGEEKRMMEEVNSSMKYCKNLCKCHNVPLYNNNMIKSSMPYKMLKII